MNASHGRQYRALDIAWRYAFAILSVAIAHGITHLVQPTVFPTPLFFVAVVVSTWFAGTGPGLFAVVLATVILDLSFLSQDNTLAVHPTALLYLAQFSLPALMTCWFVKKRKEAEAELKQARDDLDARVHERTTQLQRANEQLQAEAAERRRAEDVMHKSQADLAHLTRITTMSALATSIAHEVNQPLAAIVTTGDACLRWLAADPPNVDRAKDSVTRIVAEGGRAGDVVRRIRSLSTKTSPHKSTLQINDLVCNVVALLDTELSSNQIVVTTDLADQLPAVVGDRVQLQQVILNLIINGIESMSQVNSQLRTLFIRTEALPPNRLQVSFRDSGCGFDSAQAEHLFETFYTTKPDGIGMGLSISRTIIEAHGGQLSAAANPDHGATFQFVLPVATPVKELS